VGRVGQVDLVRRAGRLAIPAAERRAPREAHSAYDDPPEPRCAGGTVTTPTQPGVVLAGRYRLEHEHGDSLPQVEHWRAVDQVLDRPVEFYVLLAGQVDAALDAARRAALVSDARLVRVLDVGQEDGVSFVVTEKVGGRSLAEIAAAGPLPADQARAVVGELAVALETARRRGVHHLALRPSVVYVELSGAVVLTGLAVEGALLGLDRADARTTTRADAVALVQLLYAALTGHWPGAASGERLALPAAPVVDGATVAPAEITPTVPNDLDTLCAVTFGPHEDGPHSPAELAADLEPWPPVHGAELIAAAGLVPDESPAVPPAAAHAPFSSAVRRQSVRERVSGQPAQPLNPPGTPPPARPVAPTLPPVIAPGTSGGATPQVAPPSMPPTGAVPIAGAGLGVGAGAGAGAVPGAPGAPTPPPHFIGGTYVPAGAVAPPAPALPFEQAVRPSTKKKKRKTFNATPYVLVLVLGALVFGAYTAFQSLTGPAGPPIARPSPTAEPSPTEESPTDDGSPSPSPETSPTEEVLPAVIAAGLQLDPDGDGDEHPEAVDRAFDGDMGTYWFTRTYNNAEMPGKSGLGYEITLENETLVSGLTLYTNGDGGNIEVRATTGDEPTEGPVLASGAMGSETVLHFDEAVRTQTIVLWFTELPTTPDGLNRVELLEIEFD